MIEILEEIREHQEVLIFGMGLGLLVAGLTIFVMAFHTDYVNALPISDITGIVTIIDPAPLSVMDMGIGITTIAVGIIAFACLWKRAVPQTDDDPKDAM